MHQPKHCEYNNKNKDNRLAKLNDESCKIILTKKRIYHKKKGFTLEIRIYINKRFSLEIRIFYEKKRICIRKKGFALKRIGFALKKDYRKKREKKENIDLH